MKRYNDYFTLLFVTFLTLFSFFHMSTIVDVSHDVITIVFKNLLPSLLPFMILVSLCLNLGILDILAYFLQIPFYNLFSLTPMMSSLYFVSFFCGYPTNVKIIKEAYELNYIDLDELQHLLSIASFSSISFIFVSLNTPYSLLIFICHLLPSLILALFYHHPQKKLTFKQVRQTLKQPHLSFVKAFKKSVLSSVYAFLFILSRRTGGHAADTPRWPGPYPPARSPATGYRRNTAPNRRTATAESPTAAPLRWCG